MELCSGRYLRTVQSKESFDNVVVLMTAPSPHHKFVVIVFIDLRISQDRVSHDDGTQRASHSIFQLLKVDVSSDHVRQCNSP